MEVFEDTPLSAPSMREASVIYARRMGGSEGVAVIHSYLCLIHRMAEAMLWCSAHPGIDAPEWEEFGRPALNEALDTLNASRRLLYETVGESG